MTQNKLIPDNNNILMKLMGGLSEDNVNKKITAAPSQKLMLNA